MSAHDQILQATKQPSLDESLAWIAADHALSDGVDEQGLLRALAEVDAEPGAVLPAIRQLARKLTISGIDTAAEIFRIETALPAEKFRHALDVLAAKSPGRTLARVNASAVIAAQREEPCSMETLCAVAGLGYSDLRARVDIEVPADPRGRWSPSQIEGAFRLIDKVVRGATEPGLPGAVSTRALELIPELAGPSAVPGWETVERMRRGGVPYEILLAQRVVGGAWLAHRNRTSGMVGHALAHQLCDQLMARGIEFKRSIAVGGETPAADVQRLAQAGRNMVGLVVINSVGDPCYGVIFSTASDSGTARTNAGRLRTLGQGLVPLALVLTGAGWADRNETGDLALEFGGRVYSERTLDRLALELEEAAKP